MRLAIVIPTFNRSSSLARTLRSILAAPVPEELQLTVPAVNNRSTDDTRAVVEQFSRSSGGMIRYTSESRGQGRSFALNAGIRETESELVGFVIGWADFGECRRSYADKGFDALLMGGNCVLRRSCFSKVGVYSNLLGRKGNRLLAGEDSDMHDRLIAAGLNGLYLPELIVYHHIPAQRVTRHYMRRWAFWSSASTGYMLRTCPPTGPRWCGLPRYMFTNAVRSQVKWLHSLVARRDPAEIFDHELRLWRLGGTVYGRHFLSDPGMD